MRVRRTKLFRGTSKVHPSSCGIYLNPCRFLRELRKVCLSTTPPGNKPFWEAVRGLGNSITLIGKSEALKTVSLHEAKLCNARLIFL